MIHELRYRSQCHVDYKLCLLLLLGYYVFALPSGYLMWLNRSQTYERCNSQKCYTPPKTKLEMKTCSCFCYMEDAFIYHMDAT